MEITTGMMITGISVAGIIACLIALAVSGRRFKKQREKLLSQLETE